MKPTSYKLQLSELSIHRLIDGLLHLFTEGKRRLAELNQLKELLQQLDSNNPEYFEILHDRRENMKIILCLVNIFMSAFVDFFVLYNAMLILEYLFGIPRIFRFLVPVFLIIVELIVSYFAAIRQLHGEKTTWAGKRLQYLVILILAVLSIAVVLFSISGYNPAMDGKSFFSFALGTALIQIGLLIPSIMLHLWLIYNAYTIAEAVAYTMYKIRRDSLVRRISRIENENMHSYVPQFTRDVRNLLRAIDSFKRMFPEVNIQFEKTMPTDLVRAINLVMGKRVFVVESEDAA